MEKTDQNNEFKERAKHALERYGINSEKYFDGDKKEVEKFKEVAYKIEAEEWILENAQKRGLTNTEYLRMLIDRDINSRS